MPDIGATLRDARIREGIDISEVETRTKIRARYLRAIENEEWDLLPGPVYAKSFLRTYGDYLGLDSRMLVDEYRRRYEHPTDHDLRPMPTLSRERERSARGPLLPPWVLIGVVLVAVVAALFVIGLQSKTKNPPATSARPGRAHRHRHHPAAPAKPKRVKLQLVPTGPVYVCLVNGSGAKLINEQTFSPGQTIPTQTAKKLLLTLGNNAVQVKVNGRIVPIAASASAIRLAIDPTGTHRIPLSTTPTCP